MASCINTRKKLRPDSRWRARNFYRIARDYGFDKDQAKGWAMYAMERNNQGSSTPFPGSFRRSKYADPKLYDRLVGNDRISVPAIANQGYRALAMLTNWPWKQIRSRVIEVDTGDVRGWANITRGRDLFVPGWGGFDVQRAMRDLMDGSAETSTFIASKYWDIPSVWVAMSWGYFENGCGQDLVRGVMTDEAHVDGALGRYVKQHMAWCKVNAYSLDEVEMAFLQYRERHPGQPVVEPETLLHEQRERARSYNGIDDRVYQFPVEPKTVNMGNRGELNVITNSTELRSVANELHNCAGGSHYVQSAHEGSRIFVVARDCRGKAQALGELFPTKTIMGLDGEWGQIAGPCNSNPDRDIRTIMRSQSKYFAHALTETVQHSVKKIDGDR